MTGTVEGIYLAAKHGDSQRAVPAARLTIGVGLEGDRHANSKGGVVTLIEAEAVERFIAETGLDITAADTGRNIATRGIGLILQQSDTLGDQAATVKNPRPYIRPAIAYGNTA